VTSIADYLMVVGDTGNIEMGSGGGDASQIRLHVYHDEPGQPAIWGESESGNGVIGTSNRALVGAVAAVNTAIGGYGVYAEANGSDARGLYGRADNGVGVFGSSDKAWVGAVAGVNTAEMGYGVAGESHFIGVYGKSNGGAAGLYGESHEGSAVAGNSANGNGIRGISQSGFAGLFTGNVSVQGNLTKNGGAFRIDHPLDPENKYLHHSFVESPDRMNIYNGNAILDENGEAEIEMPDWFMALNRDFRYQLTPVGAPGPNLYVSQKIIDGKFRIAGGTSGLEVSWQVTGIRQDPWANANPIQVEEEKPQSERGKYLIPKLYGQPKEKGIHYSPDLSEISPRPSLPKTSRETEHFAPGPR